MTTSFTSHELALIKTTLRERYDRDIPFETAEAEICLNPDQQENLSLCEVVTWSTEETGFVIFKITTQRFRAQFFTSDNKQYGVGKQEFDNLGDCLITLLQIQSDFVRERAGIKSSINAFNLPDPDSYDGPLII